MASSSSVRSNLRSLATWTPEELSQLLRGPGSLGGRLETHGYSVAPSPENPVPLPDYFDGGLSVALHGSRYGGSVDGMQIEVPYSLLETARRPILAKLLAEAILGWMDQTYGFDLASPGSICSGFADIRLDAPGGQAVAAMNLAKWIAGMWTEPAAAVPSRVTQPGPRRRKPYGA